MLEVLEGGVRAGRAAATVGRAGRGAARVRPAHRHVDVCQTVRAKVLPAPLLDVAAQLLDLVAPLALGKALPPAVVLRGGGGLGCVGARAIGAARASIAARLACISSLKWLQVAPRRSQLLTSMKVSTLSSKSVGSCARGRPIVPRDGRIKLLFFWDGRNRSRKGYGIGA